MGDMGYPLSWLVCMLPLQDQLGQRFPGIVEIITVDLVCQLIDRMRSKNLPELPGNAFEVADSQCVVVFQKALQFRYRVGG